MSGELAGLEALLTRLGVANGSEDAADALTLLRAVSAEVREMTGRQYEGVATVYDMTLDADWQADFLLPHVPVTDLLSLAAVEFDGTEDQILDSTRVASGWTTSLAAALVVGDTNAKVTSVTGMAVGDHLDIRDREVARITAVGTAGSGGTGLTIEPAIRYIGGHPSGAALSEVLGSGSWRLVDATRGKVELAGRRRFLRAVWRVSGDVPVTISEAVLDWCDSRWSDRKRSAGQTAYSTGDDSESWDASLAGSPPPSVGRTLARAWRRHRNGVV